MSEPGFAPGPDEARDRSFVTALARGLDVLRCFRAGDLDLTNADISGRTGLPKATVSRLTHTLCALDYLVADPRTGTYRLGVGVLQLGFGVLAGMDIGERAAEVLGTLRNGPNSYITAALGERHRGDVVYVAVRRSRENVSLAMHVGSRLPLFHSAIGRAILVAMQPGDRESVFDAARRDDPAGEAARCAVYERAAAEHAEMGFCTGYGEWRSDVNGIAVPVTSLDGIRLYGLNVGGPSFRVSRRQLEDHYGPLLIEAARTLSLQPRASGG
ncbi:MAG: IclR family transcriptional regulator [Rhodobacteraceae bacterium]|nr:IclR family transcriptional regulator [Paracoccaceae bacterium]